MSSEGLSAVPEGQEGGTEKTFVCLLITFFLFKNKNPVRLETIETPA